jgi:hypothetical protein
MKNYLFVLLIFPSIAQALPVHCSPNPPDGTLYVKDRAIKYDGPIPSPCYSVMKDADHIFDMSLVVFNGKAFVEDAKKVAAREEELKQKAAAAAAEAAALDAIRTKVDTMVPLTPEETKKLWDTVLPKVK